MPCPCSTVAIASWEIRVRFAFPLCHGYVEYEWVCLRRVMARGWIRKGDRIRRVTFGGEKARNPRRGEKGLREDRSENTKPEIAVPTACRHVDTFEPILDGEWVFYFYFFFFFNLARADCRVFFGIELGTNRRWWWRKFLIRGSRESPWREINLLTLDDYKKWWYRERENSKYVRVKEKEKKRRKKIWRKQESVTKDESELLLV